ncbi:hypothetical protein [Salmonella phage GRNsp7]|nr:hypothetical protein [Salmonella phage GRNsp7]
MKSYAQFLNEVVLNEASASDVRAVATAAIKAGKYSYKDASDESRYKFYDDMRAEGFVGNYVTTAWKSLVATGAAFEKPSGKPAPKADPKAAQEKNIAKGIISRYEAILKELLIIKTEGQKLARAHSFKDNPHAHDLEYVEDLQKIIKDRIWSAKQIK